MLTPAATRASTASRSPQVQYSSCPILHEDWVARAAVRVRRAVNVADIGDIIAGGFQPAHHLYVVCEETRRCPRPLS